MSDKVLHLTSASFEAEVLQAREPVLVDFWATWCPPCRMIAPTIDALAGEYAGRVKVAKLDVDEAPEVAQRYGIQSIPSLLVFKDGKVVDQRIGALPRAEMARMLDSHAPALA
ncbi:MAG TPA: thioredoxin [Vicinamibacteria bacterium]